MTSLDTFLTRFGAESFRGDFAAKWEAALAANPPVSYAASFLAPERIEAHWRMSPLRPDSLGQVMAIAERVRADQGLLTLAAFMHWRIFVDSDPDAQWQWPTPSPLEGTDIGTFHLLVALGFPTEYTKAQKALGIPDDVISASCGQIACYAFNFHRATGRAGIFLNQLAWLHVYFPPGRYYRLGRLEFQASKFSRPFKVFRRKSDGRTAAIALPGQWYAPDGEACLAGCDRPGGAWEPAIAESAGGVEGHPVLDNGRLSPGVVRLESVEWECVLAPGDPVLNIHIPSGGGMEPELVRDSLGRAFGFFDRHFPAEPAKALVCTSWICSNQLVECLPPDSNILSFQKMAHLLPVSAQPSSGLWFVFLKPPPYPDPASLPRDTSMRRAIADWLAAGNVFHLGGMYILREEVARG